MSAQKHKPEVFAGRKAWLVLACIALCFAAVRDSAADRRIALLPRLHTGQALHYQIHGRVQRDVTTESRVTSMARPADLKEDISLELQITIKEIRMESARPVIVAHGEFQLPNDAAGNNAPAANPGVDFTIDCAGQVRKVEGLEIWSPNSVWSGSSGLRDLPTAGPCLRTASSPDKPGKPKSRSACPRVHRQSGVGSADHLRSKTTSARPCLQRSVRFS